MYFDVLDRTIRDDTGQILMFSVTTVSLLCSDIDALQVVYYLLAQTKLISYHYIN